MKIAKETIDFWRNLKPLPHPHAAAHRRLMEKVRKMTPTEMFQSSVEAGIHNPDGSLKHPYNGEEE